MSKTLCNCKACGQEIAKSAKICPHCGAKNKHQHPILWGILAVVVLIAIVGSAGDTDEPVHVENNNNSQVQSSENAGTKQTVSTEPKNDNLFLVGEAAELNDIFVSMVSVTQSAGSAYNTPTEGNIFVLCEFEIANNSNQEITVSSAMSFEAYCDDYTCTFNLSALLEKGNKNQLDGTVAPGKKFNGVIGYEVPSDWKELEIHFTPNVWSGKEIIFLAKNAQQ